MPWNKDVLGSESVLSLPDVLGEDLTVVGDLGVHVVNEEWISEMIFVVREWHGLEVKSHGGSTFDIAELVQTSGCAGVSVEEGGSLGSHLWEVWVLSALIELLIVVNDVVGRWAEELCELLVGEDGIEDVNLVNGWLGTLVSDSSGDDHASGNDMEFPDESMWSHEEGE